jgi:hypothetical protein
MGTVRGPAGSRVMWCDIVSPNREKQEKSMNQESRKVGIENEGRALVMAVSPRRNSESLLLPWRGVVRIVQILISFLEHILFFFYSRISADCCRFNDACPT